MSEYKLTIEQMAEVEPLIEQMVDDPEPIAFELIWRRHAMEENEH